MYDYDHNQYESQKSISNINDQKILSSTLLESPTKRNYVKMKHLSKFNPTVSYSLQFHKSQNKDFCKPTTRKDVF